MGLRFRRSVRLFPGVRINFSLRGVSTTIGPRGASVGIGQQGAFLNVGVPGTGLFVRERVGAGAGARPRSIPERVADGEGIPDPEPTPPPGAVLDEIRSADNEALTSVGLREFRDLVAEAYAESRRLRSELPAIKAQLQKAKTRAHKWENGFLLRRVLRKKYAKILEEHEEAKTEAAELEQSIERCRIALEIQMEKGMEDSYGALVDSFRALAACDRCWDMTAAATVNQIKERSTATRTVTRAAVVPDLEPAEVLAPGRPAMRFPNANGGDLFLLPGMLLVFKAGADFALIGLGEVLLEYTRLQCEEEQGVPADSKVVGETWKKVNKDGRPDRRFKDNYKIPVAQYGQLRFASVAGLNEEYMFSNAAKAEAFRAAFAKHQKTVPLG